MLMLNGEYGMANGYGESGLPFFKNYYAGGVTSVRGYKASSFLLNRYRFIDGTRPPRRQPPASLAMPSRGARRVWRSYSGMGVVV